MVNHGPIGDVRHVAPGGCRRTFPMMDEPPRWLDVVLPSTTVPEVNPTSGYVQIVPDERKAWECIRCGAVNAPHSDQCKCTRGGWSVVINSAMPTDELRIGPVRVSGIAVEEFQIL
jgi:hypothetical protein